MMRAVTRLTAASLLSIAGFSQSTEPAPQFEVASIQVSPQTNVQFPFMRGPFLRGGRYELRFASMVDLIRTAYNVGAEKVVGGPSWLEMDRYDLFARAQPKATPEAFRSMLQTLLADRFKLVVHPDTKPMSAYALTAGKHPSLKKSDGSGNAGCKFIPPSPPPPGGGPVLTATRAEAGIAKAPDRSSRDRSHQADAHRESGRVLGSFGVRVLMRPLIQTRLTAAEFLVLLFCGWRYNTRNFGCCSENLRLTLAYNFRAAVLLDAPQGVVPLWNVL